MLASGGAGGGGGCTLGLGARAGFASGPHELKVEIDATSANAIRCG